MAPISSPEYQVQLEALLDGGPSDGTELVELNTSVSNAEKEKILDSLHSGVSAHVTFGKTLSSSDGRVTRKHPLLL